MESEGENMMSSREILAINLKYLRKKYHMSQEKFSEVIGSNLVYLNQLENRVRKPTIDMLDKIANNINKFDSKNKITASDLIRYNKNHITSYSRIDERKKDIVKQ